MASSPWSSPAHRNSNCKTGSPRLAFTVDERAEAHGVELEAAVAQYTEHIADVVHEAGQREENL